MWENRYLKRVLPFFFSPKKYPGIKHVLNPDNVIQSVHIKCLGRSQCSVNQLQGVKTKKKSCTKWPKYFLKSFSLD